MAVFRLLHASDFHLATTPYKVGGRATGRLRRLRNSWRMDSHDPNVLRAFAQFAHLNRKGLDALIVTGDLATTGRRADLAEAYDLCTAPAAGGSHLTPAGKPTVEPWARRQRLDLLPGNHDRYRRGPLYRPGGTVFDTVFCAWGPGGGPAGTHFWRAGQGAACALSLPRGRVRLHVVKADLTLRLGQSGRKFWGLPGWFGQGRVHRDVLLHLKQLTQQLCDDSRRQREVPAVVWAIHFDPFSTDGTLQLLRSHRLVNAAREARVVAVLCGHTHESKLKPLSEATLVCACGTTTQAGSPQHDCQVLEFDVDDRGVDPTRVTVKWYRYDDGPKFFRRLMTVTR